MALNPYYIKELEKQFGRRDQLMEGSDFVPSPKPKGEKKPRRRPTNQSRVALAVVDTYLAQVDRSLADLKKAVADLKASLS